MGTIWVRELTGGLDTRRMPEATKGGALIRAVDGHINSGGEFEQRAAFVAAFTLPTGTTVGLAPGKTGLHVFGHTEALGIPPGITYQRLQHPDGVTALVSVPSATLSAGKIYAVGEFADGSRYHFYDGSRDTDWVDGRARVGFTVAGSAGGALTDLTIDGVSLIGSPVAWTTSNAATALAIASAINEYSSTPDYVATVVDDRVNILAADAGVAANGRVIAFVTTGGLLCAPLAAALALGVDTPADHFEAGTFVKTVQSKIYATAGPNLHFSGIRLPTGWDSGSVGAGFLDVSQEAEGAERLTAVAKYQQFLVVFADRVTLVLYIDPDPDLNKIAQILYNTGTTCPRTVTQFGDNDIFYLDESGLRSLRARQSSDSAATSDTGVQVDTLVTAKLRALTAIERAKVFGLIEPRSGRFWLIFPDEIFVLSLYPGSKVSAFTTYRPTTEVDDEQEAFTIDEAVVFRRQVYLRSGDTIYVYGGLGATLTYDSTAAEAWLPYLDGDTPTQKKDFAGFDAAVEGEWIVRLAMEPSNLTASDKLGVVSKTTFNADRNPGQGSSTHFSLRFTGHTAGAKKISSAVIHYTSEADED